MRPDSPLAHAKHIFRVFLLLIVAVIILILGRSLFVPDSWGRYGSYRAAAIEQHWDKAPRHGGNAACAECHEDEYEEVTSGVHHTLACEGCHAPLSVHVVNGEQEEEMPIRKSADLCLLCHQQLEARPKTQPQINPAEHLEEMGGEPGPESCFECHEAHSPL